MKKEIQFPNIKSEQVALLRSDYNTGHVLDENYTLHINSSQEMYTIFDSLQAAKVFIKNEEKKWKFIEFTIYNNGNNPIYESVDLNKHEALE